MFTACEQSSERRLQYFQKKIFIPNTKNARKKKYGENRIYTVRTFKVHLI